MAAKATSAVPTTALATKLVYKKSTPGKHVYEEVGDRADHIVGSLYIPKQAAERLGLEGKPGDKATLLIEKGWTI